MRAIIVLGVLLFALGLFTYLNPVFTSGGETQVIQAGDFLARSKVLNTLAIPLWASAAAMVTGVVLIIVGAATRTRSY